MYLEEFVLTLKSVTNKCIIACATLGGLGCITYCYVTRVNRSVESIYCVAEPNKLNRWLQIKLMNATKTNLATQLAIETELRNTTPARISDNGHAMSGAVRDNARQLIRDFVENNGMTNYEINPSIYSVNETSARHHLHYAVGDLDLDAKIDKVRDSDIITGIDIDYYIQDPSVILRHARPVILFTFNPKTVAGMDGDTPFYINNNIVDYKVNGGGNWCHKVYNYCDAGEFIETVISPWWMRWIPIEKVIYHKIVHMRPWTNAPHRALVLMLPQHSTWRIKNVKCDIQARRLKPITYQDKTRPGWNLLKIYNPETNSLEINIGREGQLLTQTIPNDLFELCLGCISTQSITSRMISMGYKDPVLHALFIQYFNGKTVEINKRATIIHNPLQPTPHWPITTEATQPELSARKYSSSIVKDHMTFPMIKRWETLSESIEYRVTFVKNRQLPNDKNARLIREFNKLMVGDMVHKLEPYSIEETIERLHKPSQQLLIKSVIETLDVEPQRLISCFNKNEASMKESRIISGFSDIRFIIMVSRYTFMFTDKILKHERNAHWYMPGNTPQGIADRVCEFVSLNGGLVSETDYTNLDGSVSPWMQDNIAKASLLRAFKPEYHDEIKSFMKTIKNCPAVAKRFGFRYDPGFGVKSGSPTTTMHNTIFTAAMQFIAAYNSYPNCQHEHAYANIGLCFGDDGLSQKTVTNQLNRVTANFGLKIKVEHYEPKIGLTFLARVFINPMENDTSIQDPLRTLRKLNLTARDPK